jgi:hypothetical protein
VDEFLLGRVKVRPPRDGLEREGDRRWRGDFPSSLRKRILRAQPSTATDSNPLPAQASNACSGPLHMSLQKPQDRFTSCFSPVNSSTCK